MTRTSKALKRLGVAGLAAVTIGAGMPALLAAGAQAATGPVTNVNITSTDNQAATGSCLAMTAQASDASATPVPGATITVTISDSSTSTTSTQDVNFCTASTGTIQPQTGTVVSNGGAAASDTSTFVADSNGTVTFGVTATVPGQVFVRAFYDVNNDKTFTAGEPQDTRTVTFTSGGAPGSNTNQDAAKTVTVVPKNDTAISGETRSFVVTVLNATNDALTGVQVSYQTTPPGAGQAQTYPTTVCGSTNNDGQAVCKVTVTTVGTDNLTFFVQQTGITSTSGFDAGEPNDTATITVNPAPTGRTVALTPANQNVYYKTGSATYTATVNNTSTGSTTPTNGTLLAFTVTGGSGDETATGTGTTNECSTTTTTGTASSCVVTVTDPTPVAGEVLRVTATIRGTTSSATSTLTFTNVPSDARNIVLSPKTQTVVAGSGNVGLVSAKVTDVNGAPVPNVWVLFTESGPGRFTNPNAGADSTYVLTNASGVASAELIAQTNEVGTDNVTATINNVNNGGTGGNACAATAGKDANGNALTGNEKNGTAGNCSDTAVVTFSSATPSPSPTTGTSRPVLSTSTPDIQPNIQGIYTATGASPNSVLELRCYTRPSTTYFTARTTTVNAAGGPVEFRILPGANTRCYARPAGNDALASNSVVINVHTTLSLSTVRTGVRTYIFQGRNLPRRAGQLITLYRVTASGQEIRTSNLTTDSSGIYRVTRKFTGTGTFRFKVRTSQTLNNAAGVSNTITVTVH
jgi:hypothetical protein